MFKRKYMRKLIHMMTILSALFIVGCASHAGPKAGNIQQITEAELAEWRELKPSIKRLVAVETELKEVIHTLAVISNDSVSSGSGYADNGTNVQTDVIEPVRFTERPIIPSEPIKTEENVPVVSNSVVSEKTSDFDSGMKSLTKVEKNEENLVRNNMFRLQLASVTSESAVEPTWLQLKKRNPQVLEELELYSEKVIVANRTYFRVKAGEFESYDKARSNCKVLIERGISCIVSRG